MKNNMLHAYICPREARNAADLSSVAPRAAQKALRFHASFPEYAETPLTVLPALAKALGVQCIFVKDESKRFGLNAFKALGGSYAMSCVLATALGVGGEPDELGLPGLTAPRALQVLGTQTFVTATDGNHGRGVAWAAKKLGHRAVVYLPRGSAAERLENIRAEGAQAFITELSYDDAVRKARRDAEENGWILLQDTAWDGYEEVPTHIMQGYLTLALEIVTQLQRTGEAPPTHLFLQAGVGSFAGAILGFFAALYGEKCPVSVIIEPESAACLYETATAGDGALHAAAGDLCTMMAGLACGEPCTVSWKILSA
ncbi:MAG: diaminopropionate ammonia-lyase, partial [Pygmaiobacter sp.]